MQSLKVFSNIYRLALPLLIIISLLVGAISNALIGSASADSKELEYSVNILPVLNVTIPTNTVSLNLHPNNKTFDSSNFNITVSTNNAYGYNLSMSSTGTSLINAADSSITLDTLPASETGYTDTTFPTNAWGYKLGSSNWTPYTSGVTLLENNAPTYGDSTNISFGAKIDYEQPAGNYNLALTFTAVAGVAPVSYMQDFTASEVDAMAEGDTRELVDSRDNKPYSVAKINDLVWMTKNLDLAGGTTLTAADSNIASGCNLGTTCTLPASSTEGFSDDSTAYVYNSGSTTCGKNSPCYSYYSYAAATAGTGATLESGEAPSDICPKGWRLPTSIESETLIETYDTGAKLVASPFLGVYAGYYEKSSLYVGGSGGFYWSSTASSSTNAYRFDFTSSYVGVNNGRKRYGWSVRCVKTGE